MKQLGQRASAWALSVVCAGALMACGGGGGGDPAPNPGSPSGQTSNNGSNGNGPSPSNTQPMGTYWSWRTVPRTVLGALGYPYTINVFEYYFVTFYSNGLAYVGPPQTDAAATRCDAVRTADDGTKLCVPYSVANGQLTLDGETQALSAKAGGVWAFGETEFTPLPATRGDTLNGDYTSIDCYWASCTRAWIQFTVDGRYQLDTLSTSVYTVPDFFASHAANGDTTKGSYRVEDNAMVLTPDGGTPFKVYYFRDRSDGSDTVLLGDTRYSIDKPTP